MGGFNSSTITVGQLLVRLFRLSASRHRTLYYKFLSFCADVVDHHEYWQHALVDHLQAPLPFGNARHLPIDPLLKAGVAQEAAKGKFGKSGAAVCGAVMRLRGLKLSRSNWNVNISVGLDVRGRWLGFSQ